MENCQLLGRAKALSANQAKKVLLNENAWIHEHGYKVDECFHVQVVTKELLADIKEVVDYLWSKAERSYKSEGCPSFHIFVTLARLNQMFTKSE